MAFCIFLQELLLQKTNPHLLLHKNITEENYADFQTELLVFLSEQIAELQSFYNNVSEASDASDLQEVLSGQKPANRYGPDGMNMVPGGMNQGS